MNKKQLYLKLFVLIFFFSFLKSIQSQNLKLSSPDKLIEIKIQTLNQLKFQVNLKNNVIIENVNIGIEMSDGRSIGSKSKVRNIKRETVNQIVNVPIPNKDRKIETSYNQMTISLTNNFDVIFRAYNDGVAYRIHDKRNKPKNVIYEKMSIDFPERASTYFPWEESMYSHNERLYNHTKISKLNDADFCSLPVLIETDNGKVLFTESSLHNYPGMFLEKKQNSNLISKFPNYVLKAIPAGSYDAENGEGSDRTQDIVEEANFIAKLSGSRNLPWRVFIVSDDDRTFVESNLVTILSEKSKIEDTSWIKPGKVAWDWWNSNNIYGVDFKAGINQDTYKYYIDFASENGIEYILLDEGWTKSTTEIYEANPNIQIKELISYAKSKNVGVLLWVLWKPLNEDTEGLIKLYSSWGAVGVKVDFMQRNDQYMVQSYEEIAEIAAKYKFLVDYHGAFKPAGIERVWPNLLTYEGVMGNEQNKWNIRNFPYSDDPQAVDPEHNLTIPFIRMAAGPLDYTPGGMTNVNLYDYKWDPSDKSPYGFDRSGNPLKKSDNITAIFTRPMVPGTRAHQVAMYTVFESPLQMMCESPTIYKKEQETVDFITQIPTTWDETVVIKAKLSDYIVIARRNGENWYLAAMTDWTARNFEVDLSFLDNDLNYKVQVYKDGINADRNAMDYKFEKMTLNKNSKMNISMSRGGGFSAIFKK